MFSIFESCYWHIVTPEYTYRDSSYVELVFWQADQVDLFVYVGTDRRNITSFIEKNDTVVLGAPFRIPIADDIMIVAQTQYQGPTGQVSFSYQLFAEEYPFYEQPFLGIHEVWWYICFITVLASPILLILSIVCCAKCCCRRDRIMRRKVMPDKNDLLKQIAATEVDLKIPSNRASQRNDNEGMSHSS